MKMQGWKAVANNEQVELWQNLTGEERLEPHFRRGGACWFGMQSVVLHTPYGTLRTQQVCR